MSLKLQVFTLNCGNGAQGKGSSAAIVADFVDSEADLFILNFQEVDFNAALTDLREAAQKTGLKITAGPTMVTHTKLSTQFHNNTGIMSLMLHRSDLGVAIDPSYSFEARREDSRFGKGYNKGGLLTRLIVHNTQQEHFSIDTFSGHLDAFSVASRALDWANLHRLQKHRVSKWSELCLVIPDLSCSGFDANTRNKLFFKGKKPQTSCAWRAPYTAEMQGFIMAPLGNHRLSQESTYHTELKDVLITPDKNREGYARGGMLDLVAYSDKHAIRADLKSLVDETAFAIPPELSAARDHAVIGSKPFSLEKENNEFDRVRIGIACALVDAAPQLAVYLLSDKLRENEVNRVFLLTVYQAYLSPAGLLQKQLQLQAKKLEYLARYQEQTMDQELVNRFQQLLFDQTKPWFLSDAIEFPITQEKLQGILIQHKLEYEIDRLKSRFLHQAKCPEEWRAIHLITGQFLQHLPEQSESKQWLEQAKKVLLSNRLVHKYAYHLYQIKANEDPDATSKNGELLADKQEKVKDLQAILEVDDRPEVILRGLELKLQEYKEELSQHRDEDFLSKLYRGLVAILKQKPSPSQGAFFVSQVEDQLPKHLGSEQEIETKKSGLS